jgi:hypothetical protein
MLCTKNNADFKFLQTRAAGQFLIGAFIGHWVQLAGDESFYQEVFRATHLLVRYVERLRLRLRELWGEDATLKSEQEYGNRKPHYRDENEDLFVSQAESVAQHPAHKNCEQSRHSIVET